MLKGKMKMSREQTDARTASRQSSRTDNVKKSSVQRKNRSHKKSHFVYIVLLLLVIAAVVGLSFTVIFNTEEIIVENSAVRYSDEAIINASGIKIGDNMPSMNVSHIAKKIEKELPYIGSVNIKRSLTNTVTVSVEYTRAAIAVPTVSGYAVLDASGKVLETGVYEPADYVAELFGAEIKNAVPGEKAVFTDSDMFTYVTGLVSDFEKEGYRNLTALDMNNISDVTAEIDYRITVRLGNITKAASKLKFGKRVIDENLANTASGRMMVDLTEDSAAYVRTQKNIDAAQAASEAASAAAAENTTDENEPASEADITSVNSNTDEAVG